MKTLFAIESVEATIAPTMSSNCTNTSIIGTAMRAAAIIVSFGAYAVYCLAS